MIYLDNGATSWPKPEQVYTTMDEFLRTKGANPGRGAHKMALAAAEVIYETRREIAKLFNVPDPKRVIFGSNATDGLNLALKGFLRSGDHVITSTMEHNSVTRPLRALQDQGISLTKVRADREGWVDPAEVEKAITPETRLIVIAHVSNVTGTIQEAKAIGRIARERGLFFLLDAAQSAGVLPIDMEADYIDFLAFPGHKGLFGPPGTGGLCLGERISTEALAPERYGGTGGNSEEDVHPSFLPNRYEAGTLNAVGIAGLGAGVDFVLETGVENIRAHEQALTERLIAGLKSIPGVKLYVPAEPEKRAAVVSFNIEGWEPGDVGAALDQSFDIACRTGLHCAPDAARTIGTFPQGTVRFCPGYFNNFEEIEQAIDAVRKLAGSAL
ncbi:MAG: aminotransferase class V-fold PLP-dependent enzyme [Anaerolineae bacterium]